MEIDLLDDGETSSIALNLTFDDTSLDLDSPIALSMSSLDGTIKVTAPVRLSDPSPPPDQTVPEQVVFDLRAAAASVTLGPIGIVGAEQALAGTGIRLSDFLDLASLAVTNFLREQQPVAVPLGITVRSGRGHLSPNWQFDHLEVHCIPNQDRRKQSLALFGVLVSFDSVRDYHQKAVTALLANQDFCVSVGPNAFRELMFCPAVAKSFPGKELPATCGSAPSVDKGGVAIDRLDGQLGNGEVIINGHMQTSGTCYSASGAFDVPVTLSAADQTITPAVGEPSTDIDVDIDFWCEAAIIVGSGLLGGGAGALAGGLAGGISGSFIGLVIGELIVGPIADEIGNALAQSRIASGITLTGQTVPAFLGARFNSIGITPEGITIQGRFPLLPFELPPQQRPAIDLVVSIVDSRSRVVSQGTYHSVFCPIGDFPYQELAKDQVATCLVVPTLLGRPLSLTWEVSSNGSTKVLFEGSGTITVPVQASSPFPIPLGTFFARNAEIDYQATADRLILRNRPEDGNYDLGVRVFATDPIGTFVNGSGSVWFRGDFIDMPGYEEAWQTGCTDPPPVQPPPVDIALGDIVHGTGLSDLSSYAQYRLALGNRPNVTVRLSRPSQ